MDTKMPLNDKRNLKIDAIHRKITQARHELELYGEECNQCQKSLARAQEQRSRLEAENQWLQRRNSQLETQLRIVNDTLMEAIKSLEEFTRFRTDLEQRDVMLSERIQMLESETQKAKEHAHEASDRLTLCEKKLDANLTLQADGKVSSEEKTYLERKIDDLYDQLKESDKRAKVAEANIQQLQQASKRLNQDRQQRLSRPY